ncbi:hypothetical protein PILCRDRAFT_8207 [Piloderma croceum F 1598]|uniref:Uncharacterized protein n=1 Tax=Piloderma croceum (strain F 1598) TaxID=765440 RepID=A0A0C3B6T0_PILCF|nr:hypothetical protein PILCRDRAFT_8207 [Piloderma croceum F 1598]
MRYSAAAFNSLPSLDVAEENFKANAARQYLEGPIRQVFLEFDVESKYGLTLLHNHFPLKENKRLVDYNNTATAWSVDDDVSAVSLKYNGLVVPRTYMFENNDIIPYEFSFVPPTDTPVSIDTAFFDALNQILTNLGLEKLFGVRNLKDHDKDLSVEVTEGDANIMLPHDDSYTSADLIEALWVFGLKTTPCWCQGYCWRGYGVSS